MGHGRVFALYVLLYVTGRGWIEALRIDPVNTVGGLRLNVWTSILVGIGALVYLVWSARTRPGREEITASDSDADTVTDTDTDTDTDPQAGSHEDSNPTSR